MAAALPVAWLDGSFLPLAEARISPLDRGFLFGDAVYEVIPVYGGRPFLCAEHLARLERSLAAVRMRPPLARREWEGLLAEMVARNGGGDMSLYLQVSRGADRGRDHSLNPALAPTVFLMAAPLAPLDPAVRAAGVAAITLPDQRWRRCDIKSTALLANVLAKSIATEAGATEAILLSDGWLREGASSSVLVIDGGTLCAPPYGPEILPGTTRDLALRLAARDGTPVRVAPLSEQQLRQADEIVLAYATRGVLPVTCLDGAAVGAGRPGPAWRRLDELFAAYRREVAGTPTAADG